MMNKSYSLLILLSFLILPIVHSSSCTPKCGDIKIPYPFGIEKGGCYLEDWYKIECRSNAISGKVSPFLQKLNMEVVSISLPMSRTNVFVDSPKYSSIRVKSSISSMGCSSNGEKLESTLDLRDTPFFFGDKNYLVAVGCNNKASVTNVEPNVVGCETTCNTSKHGQSIPFFNKIGCSSAFSYSKDLNIFPSNYIPVCNETGKQEDTNGFCLAKAPTGAQQLIGVTITNTSDPNLTKGGECNVAFLTDEVYTFKNISNPEVYFSKGSATLNLGWFIQTKNHSFLESLGCQYGEEYNKSETYSSNATEKCTCYNHTASGITYASCSCNNGYKGNPYLLNACQDINECENSISYPTYCKNTLSSDDFQLRNIPILIGFGAGSSVVIISVGTWLLKKLLRKTRKTKRKRKFFKRNGGLLLQQQLHTAQGRVEKTKIFSSKDLKKATDNFNESRIIGQGGQGTVYKGMLVDGSSVAVKKSSVVDEDRLQEFINELIILSQINHRHVVKLLGCCLETEVPILVYEFITNGNLFQHLHEEFDEYTALWGVRMRIAVDIAGAFSYLHTAASSPIYHRDIKSTNILLDEKYRAKVSDFGTSRSVTIDHTHWTTVISGTVGYVDPEYYGSSHFTEKSDVYSFGVVLAELITGEKPVITLSNTKEMTGLADYFRLAMKENRLSDIIDARIKNECNLDQVIAMANLAMRCLKKAGKSRPDMREVYTALERICSSPEDFQVELQIDGEEGINRDDSWSTVTSGRM